jgi:hypothetical protein
MLDPFVKMYGFDYDGNDDSAGPEFQFSVFIVKKKEIEFKSIIGK